MTKKFDDKNVFGFDLPKKTGEVKELTDNKNKKLEGYMACKNVTDIRTIKSKLAYEEWKKELIEQGVPITSGRSCNYQKSYYENVEWTPLNVSNYD